MAGIRGPGWQAVNSDWQPPNKWEWRFHGATPWVSESGRTAPGDFASLKQWMEDMNEWGTLVATKCKDLEARVSFLEDQLGAKR
jgi:hypothetical protein